MYINLLISQLNVRSIKLKNIYIHEVKIYFYSLLRIKRTTQKLNTFLPGVLIRKRTPHIILPQQLIFFSKFKQRIILHSQTNLVQDVVYCLTFITLFCK